MSFSLLDPTIWASLLTLTALEIVLGIDNVVFLAVVVARLPPGMRPRARQIGLALALALRILLLLCLTWIIGLKEPIFTVGSLSVSWRDLILIAGGLFLLAKGTHEIHRDIEGEVEGADAVPVYSSFPMVIAQVALIDLVFSIDSIVTAIGIADHIEIMIIAVIIAMIVMYAAAGAVSSFIERHPTTKMLALSFLLLIGMALVADGLHFHIPREYIYFAMAFSAAVEMFNVLARRRRSGGVKH